MTKQTSSPLPPQIFDEKQIREYATQWSSEIDKWLSYLCSCWTTSSSHHHTYKEEIFDPRKEPGLYCHGSLYETYEIYTDKGKHHTEHMKSGIPCRII
jgi:hypothetical protein